jgi:predicted metal-dependent hydrolase
VVRPAAREDADAIAFLIERREWVLGQIRRLEGLRHLRKPDRLGTGELLLRGQPVTVRVEHHPHRRGGNRVVLRDNELIVISGASPVPVARTLESWLREQARITIKQELEQVTTRLGRTPGRIFVMGQRTKWGSCSASRNLSFNWRLILAPVSVLRYLVIHEAVHLVIPDHSARFWLTVQSHCPGMERARQWLAANGERLRTEPTSALSALSPSDPRRR